MTDHDSSLGSSFTLQHSTQNVFPSKAWQKLFISEEKLAQVPFSFEERE
jgi:hypothetical protein